MSWGKKSTETTSTTQNTSSTDYRDESVNAGGDGSLALGAGAEVNTTTTVIDVSDEVAKASLDAQRDTAAAALAENRVVSSAALAANRDVSGLAIETTGAVAGRAFDTALDLFAIGSRERTDQMQESARVLQSNQGLVDRLSSLTSAALERSQTPDSAVTKQLLWVVGGSVVAVALLLSRRR